MEVQRWWIIGNKDVRLPGSESIPSCYRQHILWLTAQQETLKTSVSPDGCFGPLLFLQDLGFPQHKCMRVKKERDLKGLLRQEGVKGAGRMQLWRCSLWEFDSPDWSDQANLQGSVYCKRNYLGISSCTRTLQDWCSLDQSIHSLSLAMIHPCRRKWKSWLCWLCKQGDIQFMEQKC